MLKQGVLSRNEIGRFCFADIELTSGDQLEIRLGDQWIWGRIEYKSPTGYYLHAKHVQFVPPMGCVVREVEHPRL